MSLIDKEALRKAVYENFRGIQCYDGSGQDICMEIDEIIDSLPTAEEEYLKGYLAGCQDTIKKINELNKIQFRVENRVENGVKNNDE
jgi:hypothetical protein